MTTKVLAMSMALTALQVGCRPEAHPRPKGIPCAAVWAGGVDGGNFFDCETTSDRKVLKCTVYNESDGSVMMSGAYCHPGYTMSTTAPAIAFTDYDAIYLVGGIRLAACSSPVPTGVPPGAMLSKNGVFVSCRQVDGNGYHCDTFLAADGRLLNCGLYWCDVTDWLQRRNPVLVQPDEINLEGGGVCLRSKSRQ